MDHELLAPAGDLERLDAALRYGAVPARPDEAGSAYGNEEVRG